MALSTPGKYRLCGCLWRLDSSDLLSSVVSSGSVTVNADSSVQLLAEEAVTLDMLDLGVSSGWGN